MIRAGSYFAGFSRPDFISDDLLRRNLSDFGARDIVLHKRDGDPPPVDPSTDPQATDDWDEWLSFALERDAEPQGRLWAWLVPAPSSSAPSSRMPLELRPGRNVWLWARTDRDEPEADDVITSIAALMALKLGDLLLSPPVDLPDGGKRYHLSRVPLLDTPDNARAVLDVTASQDGRISLPTGEQRWQHETDQPEPLAISAERPWFVLVDLDWRGPKVVPDEWPRQTLNAFGLFEDPLELDMLLLEARYLGATSRPDDTFLDELTPSAPQVRRFFDGMQGFALVALVAWLWFNKRTK